MHVCSKTTYSFHSTSHCILLDTHSNRWKVQSCNLTLRRSHHSSTLLHLQRMAHGELKDADTSWCHPGCSHRYLCMYVIHNLWCDSQCTSHSCRHMSLTGMVLGTVLSKERVAAVAESILTPPSIHTRHTATVCAWKCTEVYWWTREGTEHKVRLIHTCALASCSTTGTSVTCLTLRMWHKTRKKERKKMTSTHSTHLVTVVCSHPQWMEAYTRTHLYHSCNHSSHC